MTSLTMFIPITKVDAAKRLVYGLATAETEDRSGEICDYASTKPNYEKWSGDIAKATNGKSFGNLRAMHGNIAAGKVTSIGFNDDAKQIEICAKVVDDAEWNKVQEGVYTGFSQGGSYEKRWADADSGLMRYTANPSEISLVDLPCLPGATFQMIKADGAAEIRHFQKEAGADGEDGTPDQPSGRKRKKAKARPVGEDGEEEEQGENASADADDGDGEDGKDAKNHGDDTKKMMPTPISGNGYEQVWRSKIDGSVFHKKDDLIRHNARLTASAAISGTTAPLLKALDGIEAKLGIEKREFSTKEREDAAESGAAMPDGSFPIKTKADLENAVQAYGRSKDKEAAKKHIIARAKALDAVDMLPDGWIDKAAHREDLTKSNQKKSLGDADRFAAMHEHTSALIGKVGKAESFSASDMDRLHAIANHCAILLDQQYSIDRSLQSMSRILDLAKMGARHNKPDMEAIQAVHDKSVELGAKCAAVDMNDKSVMPDMTKALVQIATLTSEKSALDDTLKQVLERIKRIEETPLPLPILSAARAVSKGHEFSSGNEEKTALAELEKLTETKEGLEKLQLLLIKAAQANPQPMRLAR
jgi:hypothetical protein